MHNNARLRLTMTLAGVTLCAACSLTRPGPGAAQSVFGAPQSQSGEAPAVAAPAPAPPQPRRPRVHTLSPASASLVGRARTQSAAGDFIGASASIERALRIEPDNPLLWIEMSKLRELESNPAQAESFARKALDAAAGDSATQAAAWRLIADSLNARGRIQEAAAAGEEARLAEGK